MRVIGIDPGCTGFIVELDSVRKEARCLKIPFVSKTSRYIDFDKIDDYFDFATADKIVLEKVGTRPAFAASAAFVFGVVAGQLGGFIYRYNSIEIPPHEWQPAMIGRGEAGTTKHRACIIFESIVGNQRERWMTHDMIDAFHLANYWLHRSGMFLKNWGFTQLK